MAVRKRTARGGDWRFHNQNLSILVYKGRDTFGHHQESPPLVTTDFLSKRIRFVFSANHICQIWQEVRDFPCWTHPEAANCWCWPEVAWPLWTRMQCEDRSPSGSSKRRLSVKSVTRHETFSDQAKTMRHKSHLGPWHNWMESNPHWPCDVHKTQFSVYEL